MSHNVCWRQCWVFWRGVILQSGRWRAPEPGQGCQSLPELCPFRSYSFRGACVLPVTISWSQPFQSISLLHPSPFRIHHPISHTTPCFASLSILNYVNHVLISPRLVHHPQTFNLAQRTAVLCRTFLLIRNYHKIPIESIVNLKIFLSINSSVDGRCNHSILHSTYRRDVNAKAIQLEQFSSRQFTSMADSFNRKNQKNFSRSKIKVKFFFLF